MKARLATIKDVAISAGVSMSTVSAVINGNKPVSADLVERVRAAVAALDFYPNRIASSLNRKRTRTLAYLAPDIANAGFLRLFKATMAVARSRGYTLVLINTDGSIELAKEALTQVIEMRADGIFLTLSWGLVQAELNLGQLRARGIEIVGVAGPWPVPDIDCFLWDEKGAGLQLGRYLRRSGHQRLLCVGPAESKSAAIRWDGIAAAYAEDEPAEIEVADTADYSVRGGYEATQRAFSRDVGATAVVAFNDAIATGALAALSDLAVSIPDEVSFLAFGGQHADYARPQITSMIFDEERLATKAANRLIDRIESICTDPAEHQSVDLTLALRNSSRRVASRSG